LTFLLADRKLSSVQLQLSWENGGAALDITVFGDERSDAFTISARGMNSIKRDISSRGYISKRNILRCLMVRGLWELVYENSFPKTVCKD
jgi:hypothetical protein